MPPEGTRRTLGEYINLCSFYAIDCVLHLQPHQLLPKKRVRQARCLPPKRQARRLSSGSGAPGWATGIAQSPSISSGKPSDGAPPYRGPALRKKSSESDSDDTVVRCSSTPARKRQLKKGVSRRNSSPKNSPSPPFSMVKSKEPKQPEEKADSKGQSHKKYRKRKICPVLACTSTSQIRLADHIRGDHPTISKEYRLSLCKRAVVVSKKEHVPQSGQGVQTLGRDLSTEAAGVEAMPSLSNTQVPPNASSDEALCHLPPD